jgi:hypothetical protein
MYKIPGVRVDHLQLSCVGVHTAHIKENNNTHTHTQGTQQQTPRSFKPTLSKPHPMRTMFPWSDLQKLAQTMHGNNLQSASQVWANPSCPSATTNRQHNNLTAPRQPRAQAAAMHTD